MTTLTFTGDVMIGRLVNSYLQSAKNPKAIWGNTLPIVKDSDALFINLETALTENRVKGKKDNPVFFFRSQPDNAFCLKEAGVDYASLANNHILDFGPRGLHDTIKTLSSLNIKCSGAGNNRSQAEKPADLNLDDLRIKIFSFTDNEPGWQASSAKAGTYFLPIDLKDERVKKLLKKINLLKNKGYFIIVSAHWGPNMVSFPPKRHREFAHALVNSGIDIFHGHSSHVFQPLEIYQGKVIMYDCGEMIDDYSVDPALKNNESFLFQVIVNQTRIKKAILYPLRIEIEYDFAAQKPKNISANLLQGRQARELNQRMIAISLKLSTGFISDKNRLTLNLKR